MTRFDIKKVTGILISKVPWRGTFAQARVRGEEFIYQVTDGTQSRYREWRFAVRVPTSSTEPIQVQPVSAPGRSAFKPLLWRSLTFKRGSMIGYRDRVYCPAAFSDVRGYRNKKTAHRGERGKMPYWLKPFRHRMRLKPTVRTTRGTDAKAQVIVFGPKDHVPMIRVYFALKCWPSLTERGLDQSTA